MENGLLNFGIAAGRDEISDVRRIVRPSFEDSFHAPERSLRIVAVMPEREQLFYLLISGGPHQTSSSTNTASLNGIEAVKWFLSLQDFHPGSGADLTRR